MLPSLNRQFKTFSYALLSVFTASNALSANSEPLDLRVAASTVEESQINNAFILLEQGYLNDALSKFEAILSVDENCMAAQLGQAMTLADMNAYQAAFESYDNLVTNYPEHAFAWNGRGLAAFNLEDFATAEASFRQAIAQQPVNGFFLESLAWSQMCQGAYAEAAEAAKQASLMYSRRQEATLYPLLVSYFAYLAAGDMENAVRTLNYALADDSAENWPAPIIKYAAGAFDADELISHVTSIAEETEAHTYIGLVKRFQGAQTPAINHFNWVARHGNSDVFEYSLAKSLSSNRLALLVD